MVSRGTMQAASSTSKMSSTTSKLRANSSSKRVTQAVKNWLSRVAPTAAFWWPHASTSGRNFLEQPLLKLECWTCCASTSSPSATPGCLTTAAPMMLSTSKTCWNCHPCTTFECLMPTRLHSRWKGRASNSTRPRCCWRQTTMIASYLCTRSNLSQKCTTPWDLIRLR